MFINISVQYLNPTLPVAPQLAHPVDQAKPMLFQHIDLRMNALMRDAGQGSTVAYREFLGELSPLLTQYFRKRLFDAADDVEDLVQECVLAIHARRHTYCSDVPVMAWAYAIARYKLIDWLRHRGRGPMHVPLDDATEAEMAQEHDRQAGRDIYKLLPLLPAGQGALIEYTKLLGYSVRETAKMMGVSEAAVKVGVHRGIKALGRLVKG